jgi:hypothetical protein
MTRSLPMFRVQAVDAFSVAASPAASFSRVARPAPQAGASAAAA